MRTTLRLAAMGLLVGFAGTAVAAGDAATGEQLNQEKGCVGCHGETGVSVSPDAPNLAGQDAQALVDAMIAYTEGDHPLKKGLMSGLSEQEMADLAAFYASQPSP
ncbi:MAG: c-type cytochrome [Gammaproteobacteria bacterium]